MWRRGNTIPVSLICIALAACAGNSRAPMEFERLVIDNSSPDAIRVSLDLGDREVLIGRVGPMSRAALRIRPGSVPPGYTRARIRAIAVGAPAVTGVSGRGRLDVPHSEWYPVEELLKGAWRYSGSRVVRMASL